LVWQQANIWFLNKRVWCNGSISVSKTADLGSNPGTRANVRLNMNKLKEYLKLSTDELVNKVTWPTWEDLQESTIIVMVASIVIALVIYAIDIVSSGALGFFYQIFQG
jgi:preprotein translocase subunit SecE